MIRVCDLLKVLTNGATHLTIYDDDLAELLFRSIWYNLIPDELLEKEIVRLQVLDFELRIGIKMEEQKHE